MLQSSCSSKHNSYFLGSVHKHIILLVILFFTHLPQSLTAPQESHVFKPSQQDAIFDPDMDGLVHLDDDGNLYLDVYAIRGQENKFMFSKNRILIVSVKPPEEVKETFERELWNFVAFTLNVTLGDIEILLFPFDAGRRILIKKGKLAQKECQDRIQDVLKPYIPIPGQTPGQTESPPLLTPLEPLAMYAHNNTNENKAGPLKYYELTLPKDEKAGKRVESIPRKKLLELKPYYNKDPSWMGKILRDLYPNKEVVIRGRLIPGTPLRPVLDDYRGPKKVRLTRKILQGIADGSGIPKPKSSLRFEISQPVPAVMMMDYLSPDKKSVVSRRVVSPLFRNDTVDLVEEFEYTEVA